MTTLFTRIIEGELPGHFALKDDNCVVFMTIAPIREGHALVVPRQPIDRWTDLSAGLSAHVFEIAHRVASAQRRVFGCDRVGLVIAGFEVNHCHLHCIPADAMSDLNFANQQQNVPPDHLADAAARLAAQLRHDGVEGAL
ncbi:MAG: HIT family protein [Actinobacteria bacterium]|nr:HIT family protein [Actinomycetota bacterium]